jgi:hypothetical protein
VASANTGLIPVARHAVLMDHVGTVKDGETTITLMMANQVPADAIAGGPRFDKPDRKVYWTKAYQKFVKEQHG